MTVCFVTGATGFLGSAVARELAERGEEVRAMTRSGVLPSGLEALGVRPWRGDLSDTEALRRAMEGAEWVFHVAADLNMWRGHRARSFEVNVEGTRRVAEAALAAGTRRLILTSSGATIGKTHRMGPDRPERVDEESLYNFAELDMVYPHTKWLSEQAALEVGARGIEVVITHPTMILGPGDWKANLLPLFQAARRGLLFAPRGYRTTCDVRDVARGHVAAAERGVDRRRYVLGGETRPAFEVFTALAEAVGGSRPRWRIPDAALIGLSRGFEAWAALVNRKPLLSLEMARQSTFAADVSSARAEEELGYRSRELDESLRDAVAFYREQGWLPAAGEEGTG